MDGTGRVGAGFWRVAIVEDHLLQRLRTEELIEHESGLKVVHACETLPDLLTWLATTNVRTRPHVVILDLVVDRGPDASADMVETLIAAGIRVLVLSALGSATLVRDVMRVGVHGIVSKRDTEADVVNAVWSVLRRRRWITSELGAALASRESRPPLSDQEELGRDVRSPPRIRRFRSTGGRLVPSRQRSSDAQDPEALGAGVAVRSPARGP